jgi:hypothetical protein
MTEPSFLVIGAQKCGTTWLWSVLRAHPEHDLLLESLLGRPLPWPLDGESEEPSGR